MTRWRCRRYQSWLVDLADGVLAAAQRQQLAQHLATCPACQGDLEALQELPALLGTSAIPDPGDAFWLQQRQAISRTIGNLREPHRGWSLEWVRLTLQFSPWRHRIAATAALILALTVYRMAAPPSGPGPSAIATQLAQLDTDVLFTLADLAQAVAAPDDALNYTPRAGEMALATLAARDLIGAHSVARVPDETEMSDTELDGMDELIGGGTAADEA
jgi:anti-sigma factor RsiW